MDLSESSAAVMLTASTDADVRSSKLGKALCHRETDALGATDNENRSPSYPVGSMGYIKGRTRLRILSCLCEAV